MELEVSGPQYDFITDDTPNTIAYGGWGGGKSCPLCVACVLRAASHQRARVVLVRKTLAALKKSTLVTLLEGDHAPPALPPGSYTHNKVDGIIRLRGAGTILYMGMGMDAAERKGSLNASDVFIDEAHEFNEKEWDWLTKRARFQPEPGWQNRVRAVCNPSAPGHFLCDLFGLGPDQHLTGKPGYRAIHISTRSNAHNLPADYIPRLEAMSPVARARYLDGRWAGAEGAVYDQWQREENVREFEGEWDRIIAACDDGYDAPFVMLIMGRTTDGRYHVIEEVRRSGWTHPEKIAAMRASCDRWDLGRVVIDDEAAGLIEEARRAGIPARPAKKGRVFDGVMKVAANLSRLTVAPTCESLIKEIEGYEWKRDREGRPMDEPQKVNDHGPDALRYGIGELCREPLKPALVSSPEDEPDEDDWGWS